MEKCEHKITRQWWQEKRGYFVNDVEKITQEEKGYLVCDDCGETIRPLLKSEKL